MKKLVLAAAIVSSFAAGSAFAQAYVGGAVGQSHVDFDCTGAARCDRTDTGYKVFGGYKFTPNVAAELVYVDYGKATFGGVVSGTNVTGEFKGTSLGAGVAVMGDFTPQWSGVARLGLASNRAEVNGSALGVNVSLGSERKSQAYVGLGVSYALSKQFKLDAALDFTRFKFQGESADTRLLSVGVTYGF